MIVDARSEVEIQLVPLRPLGASGVDLTPICGRAFHRGHVTRAAVWCSAWRVERRANRRETVDEGGILKRRPSSRPAAHCHWKGLTSNSTTVCSELVIDASFSGYGVMAKCGFLSFSWCINWLRRGNFNYVKLVLVYEIWCFHWIIQVKYGLVWVSFSC